MTISHEDLYDFAKRCHRHSEEIIRRAAISRGWYSIYHTVVPFVESNVRKFERRENKHEKTVEVLRGIKDFIDEGVTGYEGARYLYLNAMDCKDNRVHADYHLDRDFSKKSAQRMFYRVKMCSSHIKDLLESNDTKAAVITSAEISLGPIKHDV